MSSTSISENHDADTAASSVIAGNSANTLQKTEKTPDPSEIFFKAVTACYRLYVAIANTLPHIIDIIQKISVDLKKGNEIQSIYAAACTLPTESRTPNATFVFGGDGPEGLARGQKILDYLHSIGIAMDYPPGYDKDPQLKLKLGDKMTFGKYNDLSNQLQGHIEQIKNDSSIHTAQGDGIQKAANAALELTTAFLKTVQNTILAVAQNVRTS